MADRLEKDAASYVCCIKNPSSGLRKL